MIERDIHAYFRRLTNHNTHAMIDEETWTQRGTRMDFNAGQPTSELRQ